MTEYYVAFYNPGLGWSIGDEPYSSMQEATQNCRHYLVLGWRVGIVERPKRKGMKP